MRYLRYVLLLILAPSILFAQPGTSPDADADSLVKSDSGRLFDSATITPTITDPGTESKPSAEGYPSGLAPDLPFGNRRRDLLGLHDSPPVLLSYNRADGLFLGLGANSPAQLFSQRRLQGYLGFGYSFGSHYWQVYGGMKRDFFNTERPLRIGVEGHILTDTRDAWKMDRNENTAFALLAGVDTRDYFQRRGFSIGAQQFLTPRVALKLEYRHDVYKNAQREVGWSLFGPEQPFQEVPPVREGRMNSYVTNVLVDYMALRSWNEVQVGFEGQAEFGSMESDFAQYVADLRLKVTAVDEWLWLATRLRLGTATGDAPPQKFFTIGGYGTLPGFPQNVFAGNRLMLVQSDLLFSPVEKWGIRIILENNFGYVGMADSTAGLFEAFPEKTSDWKYSIGLYLGSATGRFRLGFAQRTDVFSDPVFIVRLTQPF